MSGPVSSWRSPTSRRVCGGRAERASRTVELRRYEVTLRDGPGRAAPRCTCPGAVRRIRAPSSWARSAPGSPGSSEIAVCSPPGPDGEIDPAVLAACRLAGAVGRVPDGRRPGDRRAGLRHRDRPARRRDRRARQPVRPGGQAPGARPGRDRRLRRAQRPRADRRRRRRPRAAGPRPARAGRARRRARSSSAISDSAELLRGARRAASPRARTGAVARLVAVETLEPPASSSPRRSPPSTSSWSARRPRRSATS